MAIHIDLEPVKSLYAQSDSYAHLAENPGYKLYWRTAGRDPLEAAEDIPDLGLSSQAAAVEQGVLSPLGRISGASLEQQVARHLPDNFDIDVRVVFVPGDKLAFAAEGYTIAVNVFSLELKGNKLFLNDVHLLSLLANRIHQLCTEKLISSLPANSNAKVIENLFINFLREGSATLFFTMPVSGPVYNLWQKAEQQRDVEIEKLRHILQSGGGDKVPPALARELEQTFALGGNAELTANYPLGTWMCQVIESAFGRQHLVDLLQHAEDFLKVFEQARTKFGLPEKYNLAAAR